jgi:exodeoxyribonuclease-5
MVIEGGPGTGKSFLTKHLIATARSSYKMVNLITNANDELDIVCTATTNKAAAVLGKFVGESSATIHSTIGLTIFNDYTTGEKKLKKSKNYTILKDTLIIIDEASYENKYLLKMIRDSTHKCKVLHVGDRYQLTDIRETNCPVFDEIDVRAVLTTSKRFAANGPIDQLAEQFKQAVITGVFPKIVADGTYVKKVKASEFQEMVDKAYTTPGIHVNDYKIIAWANKKVRAYNDYVRGLHTTSEAFLVGETIVTNESIISKSTGYGAKPVVYSVEQEAEVTDIYEGILHEQEGWYVSLDESVTVF